MNPESPTTSTTTDAALAPPSSPPHNLFQRFDLLITRHARLLLPIYWLLLAISTHIPKLHLIKPDPYAPPSIFQLDKFLHVFAFAILTYLIIRARPLTSRASFATTSLFSLILASAYAFIDEYTQAFADRTVSDADLIASLFGILSVYLITVSPLPYPGQSNWRIWPARASWLVFAPTLLILTFQMSGNKILTWLYSFYAQPHRGQDKDMHLFAGFALTTLLAASAPLGRSRPKRSILITLAIMALSAPIIEVIQKYTGRGVEIADVFKHFQGMIAITVLWAIYAAVRSFSLPHLKQPAAAYLLTSPASQPHTSNTNTPTSSHTEPKHFINYALIVSSLTFLSRIFGLVRDAILAWALGLTWISDAFYVAFIIPNLFRRLFGEGALTAAFIPHYTRLNESDPVIARRFAYLILALLTSFLAAITILGEASLYLANTFFTHSDKTHLILKLTMIMLPYMPLVCAVAMIGGILQVHHRFGPPAAAPVILNLTMIGFAVCGGLIFANQPSAFAPRIATIIAFGVLTAGIIQILFLLPTLTHLVKPTLNFRSTAEHLRSMLIMMLPMLIGLAVLQINTLLDTFIALIFSTPDFLKNPSAATTLFNTSIDYPMQQNSVSALYYAQRLYQFPLAIFGIAIATAIFPAFAKTAAAVIQASRTGDPTEPHRNQFQTQLHHGIRLTLFLGLPAGIGLILVREPLTRLLFERGEFSPQDTARVAHILIGYAIAIWAYSLSHVLTRAYYAHKDSLTPLKISVSMIAFNLLLNLTLIFPFGTAGLAYSTAISAIFQVGLLIKNITQYTPLPIGKTVIIGITQTLTLTFLMAVIVYGLILYLDPISRSATQSAIILFTTIAIGAATYLAAALIIGVDELKWLRKKSV
ncbi:Lipid II flippase MurJ [Poriferisphaera corsica]|uniref:Probable lipid II flippase MurJ n=1 Tax=Poriferisphaera corsica TaxID=2528020 RepID=A0A517YXN9_9BACT|nr:murein biosynthesis integral membrane protein MurJ [Poriferisphaera corsica]QDU34986.1 Lipid II flippase MurJ [Poriferisphaera corsica]